MLLNFSIEYYTQWGESLCVTVGTKRLALTTVDGHIWTGQMDVELPKHGLPLVYAYSVWRDGACIRREQNCLPHIIEGQSAQRKSLQLDDQWHDARRLAGVAIPIFSLRSEGDFGVGDFGDLRMLVDWAVATRQQVVQILPINDTTGLGSWMDSYPYNAISIYALHPQYADLRQLPALKDAEKAAQYEAERQALNALPQMDYERVNAAKRAYLHDIYEQEGRRIMATAAARAFVADNAEWLKPYAAFSALRDKYRETDFNRWPNHHQFSQEILDEVFRAGSDTLRLANFYIFMQYILHQQLLAVANHARRQGVVLKGDIPIGISRTSVEAWVEPYYFNMQGSTGAPPDTFSVNGQNWGFPTYDWQAMAKDDLAWWRKRFQKMQTYFSAYRIDHILGFFRIWEIPVHSVHGLLGQFSPAMPLSPDDIAGYGLPWDADLMTRPYIDDALLSERFGPLAHYHDEEPECWEGKVAIDYVRDTFLDPIGNGRWQLKTYFATQRQIETFFSGKRKQRNLELKEALYSLVSNVLFVEDHRKPGLWHPRIAAQLDYVYTRLERWQQDAFNRLYEDFFYHRHNQFWYETAMQRLPRLMEGTQMIVCGEDLGMVPACVPWVMEQLQILSLEVQRMPKLYGEAWGHTARYPWRSVCTTGSHDTETLRQWWEMDPALTQRYWNDELGQPGEAPAEATPDVCRQIVERHLACPSLLCVLPLQDWLAIDGTLRNPDTNGERINIPANPRHYWRWRMHLTLEQLAAATDFNTRLAEMVTAGGR